MKDVLISDKKDCCGCGACFNACPVNAIQMKEDEYGFVYPIIDKNKCINCGICQRVCGYSKKKHYTSFKDTYVAQNMNNDIMQSASGGVFFSLAKRFIEDGGVVVGVSLEYKNGSLEPEHLIVDKCEGLCKLQGSKYVQSNMGSVYNEIKNLLNDGRHVLFSGTPCQVDGLRSFLNKKYDNLFCIDIICHGTPSKRFFNDYIKVLEKEENDKIIDFKFRDKTNGWGLTANAYTANAYTANARNIIIPCFLSSYYDMFLKAYIYRENCYSCKFANDSRPGDITIGDFWGIELEHPDSLLSNGGVFDASKGISCIIVNTKIGEKLLNYYKGDLLLISSSYDKAARMNHQLKNPTKLDQEMRSRILNAYKEGGYIKAEKEYTSSLGLYVRLKNNAKRYLPVGMQNIIRTIMGHK